MNKRITFHLALLGCLGGLCFYNFAPAAIAVAAEPIIQDDVLVRNTCGGLFRLPGALASFLMFAWWIVAIVAAVQRRWVAVVLALFASFGLKAIFDPGSMCFPYTGSTPLPLFMLAVLTPFPIATFVTFCIVFYSMRPTRAM